MMVNPTAHLVPIEETEEYLHRCWGFVAPLPLDQARQRLQEYFAHLGYAPVSLDDALVMRRSSALDWSPRSKKTELVAYFNPSRYGTAITTELRASDDICQPIYEIDCRLYAWELVEAERYLREEPANFTAMKQFNHHLRMQALQALARGLATGAFFALVVSLTLHQVLPAIGIES